MKRTATGFCIAAALSCVATLGAQAPATPPGADQRAPAADKAREISVTGCVSKGADGKYMLTNAKVDSPAGATAGTSGTTPPATAGASSATANAAASWALSGGTDDLDKHVGHKVQITGKAAMDSRTPGSAAGSAAGAATTGTTGTTATAATEAQKKDASGPTLDVSSVKMIAATCS
jgi:hypothetical protein